MIKYLKNNYYYIILFIFIFLVYTVFMFPNNYGDPLANYGFSYAITRGQLPYIDFNTISTPLYSFVMSIGLFIWNNYFMFLLEQAFLVTIMFYLLEKIYGKKVFILLFVISCMIFFGINATYNFFVLFLLVVLLFLEKNYSDKDYLIGIVIGLAILSKHTVGALLILPSIIYYFKDKNKLLKRFTGLLSVILIFVLYLLLTNSFIKFIDLCILGLFDFSSNNGNIFNTIFYLSIIIFIISLIITIKDRKNISNLYLLFGISFVIPLFDFAHLSLYVMCITLQLLSFINKWENYLGFLSFVLSWVFALLLCINVFILSKPVLSKNLKHFNYLLDDGNNYNDRNKHFNLFDKYKNSLILSYSKMQYDISRDNDIDYFDVLLYGNYGYDGSNKMIKNIKNKHDIYIIIDSKSYNNKNKDSQFDKTVVGYVMTHYKKVEEIDDILIYYKK